ncbi:MAG: hypothetical protein KDE51_06665, partial [Anaerolineales bacterium]|nr:hypothetical protein [Anaerolineales bacterium]
EFELLTLWLEALELLPEGDPTLEDITDEVTAVRAAILNRLQETGYEKDHKDQPIDIDALYHHFHASGAKLDEAIACAHLSHRAMRQGDFQQAMHYFQIQPSLYEEANAPWRLATNLPVAATIMYRVGQMEAGLAMAQRSLALAEKSNDELNKSAALVASGFYTLNEQVDYETAAQQFQEVTQLGITMWEQGLTAATALIGLAWQGFIALLQGDLAETGRLAQEMKQIADVRNNPRDKNTAASFLTMLETVKGNYQIVEPSIIESVTIGHTTFARYNLIFSGCGLHNMKVAVSELIAELSLPMTTRWPTVFLYVLPAAAFMLAENGKAERAAALMAMGWAHPACPRGWWEVMDLVQKLEARLKTELSAQAYAAAQAQGREMNVQETAMALLEELKEMAATHE